MRPNIRLGIIAQIVQVGAGLGMLPVLITYLSPNELGLWYLFLSTYGALSLFDFGMTQAIGRQFAFASGGARTVVEKTDEEKTGAATASGAIDGPHLMYLQRLSECAFLKISLLMLAAGIFVALPYICISALKSGLSIQVAGAAWLAYIACASWQMYFQSSYSLLYGMGRVDEIYKSQVTTKLMQIAVTVLGLVITHSVWAPVVGAVVGSLGLAHLLQRSARRCLLDVQETVGPFDAVAPASFLQRLRTKLPSGISRNASKMGAVAICSFVVSRFAPLTIAGSLGLERAGKYAICIQIMTGIQAFASIPLVAAVPRLSQWAAMGQRIEIRREFLRIHLGSLFVFASISTFVIFLAYALRIYGGPLVSGKIPEVALLSVMAVVTLLELNHSNCAALIASGNRTPFFLPSILAAAATVLVLLVCANAHLDLIYYALCQGAIQLVYANWRWPLYVWQDYGYTAADFARLVEKKR